MKYLTISLFAYVATAIIVGGNFAQIFLATIIPHIEFTASYAMMFVAIFGTTISPYLFFWQASEEAEEDVAKHKIKEIGEGTPDISKREIMTMKKDVAAGMFFSQLITWVIILTTAGSLHMNGITDIQTVDQAALALEPLVKAFPYSGESSKVIFVLGIIGTGPISNPRSCRIICICFIRDIWMERRFGYEIWKSKAILFGNNYIDNHRTRDRTF